MFVIRRVRCGDEEEEARRLAVHRGEVHAARDGHRGKTCGADAGTFGVRRRDAVAEARRAGGLAGEDVLYILGLVRKVAAFLHEVRELMDGSLLVLRLGAEQDALLLE